MTKKIINITGYAFTEGAKEVNRRDDINMDFVKSKLSSAYNFGSDNIMRGGCYRELGWRYDVRPFLKRYVYKQHSSWHEVYALNKGNLRRLVYGHMDEIIEIK